MKKIILLFASALLNLGAMAQTMEFTFTRGEAKTATVTSPDGVTATMATNVDWLTSKTMGSRTDVLCPNRNTKDASGDNFITYTLTVSGLAPGKEFAAAKFTNIAVNSGGNLQPSNNQDIRHCNFTLSANGAEMASLTDQNIWIAAEQSNRTITLAGTPFTADAEGNLVLTLKLAKGTTNDGCFYGLTKIELLDAVHTFSADKVYYIRPQKAGTTYVTEVSGGKLAMANKDASKYQFWRLIPVEGKSHCYHIQNVVTGKYIAACNENATDNTQAQTGTEPVAYYIGLTASTINEIAGCYYMASTNWPNYKDEGQGPKCLNTGGGVGSAVVTYTAGPNGSGGYKKNSYWRFEETTDEYERPEPPVHGSSAKNLTVYFRPCGMTYDSYLTAAAVDGVDPIAYTATGKPDNFYVPFSKDRGAVRRGSEFSVSITLNSTDDADLKANAYFDWNADGEFETTAPITLAARAATATATVSVPENAVSGDTRMRIRLNSNGLDHADDDVEGFVYDFPLTVVDATTERKVLVDVNGANNGTVALSATGDSHVVGTQLTATATPKGNATFESWREGGVVVSTDAEYTFTVEDRNMTLKAYFTPNTVVEYTPAQWDFTFNRTSATEATATVTSGGKAVEGVTAAIAMSTEYKANGTLASDRTDLLCSTTNSSNATAGAPIKYTLTITNTTEKTFAFDYIEASNVALNGEGKYQGKDVNRVRNFKVTYGSTTIGPEERYICDNSHCNGKEYPQGFGAKVLVPAGGTYTIVLDIYGINHDTGNDQIGSGCFYGLSKIALGNTAVSFGTTGYTTLYAPIALTIPEGVTAYTGTLDENNTWLTLKSIEGGVIPKEHAVILESEAGNEFTLEAATGTGTTVSDNALKGQTSTVATSMVNTGDNEAYTLQRDAEDGVAFKRYTGASLAGGKAYLMLPRSLATQQKALRIRFADDGSTAIDNSEFTIQNSSFIYDLQGRRVLNPTKGVYIVNGNKVVIK